MFNRDNIVCNFEYTWLTFLFSLWTMLILNRIINFLIFRVSGRNKNILLFLNSNGSITFSEPGILPFVKKIVPIILLENFYSLYLRFSSSGF